MSNLKKYNEYIKEQIDSFNIGDYVIYNGKLIPEVQGSLVKVIEEVPISHINYEHGPKRYRILFLENDDVVVSHVCGEKHLSKAPENKIKELERKRIRWMEQHPEDPYGEELWED